MNILVLILLLVLVLLFMAGTVASLYLFPKRDGSSVKFGRSQAPPSGVFHWPGPGDYAVSAVGESFNRAAIQQLVGAHGDEHVEATFTAHLVPEDGNIHDNKAVAIYIRGAKVGHLSREDARIFRRRLGAKKLTGQWTSCGALVQYGGLVNGQRFDYSVRLDLKPFD